MWLLFIPTQLGMHFWPEWSHVMGLRVDYLAPTIYFLDLIWILMIVLGDHKGSPLHWIKKWEWIVIAFALINIFVAENHWVAGVKWLRIFQWIITFNLILNNKKLFKEMLMKVLPFWIVEEGLLATAQVINGGSLNGIFYWLGERRFSYASIGVAQISYFGEGLIRAYGTFSHPNSLAGFMLISLVLYTQSKYRNVLYWVVFYCGVLGIVLSGSRTVWILTVVLFLLAIKGGHKGTPLHKILGTLLIVGGLIALIFSLISNNYRLSDFIGGWDSDGMTKRGALMVASLKMIRDNSLFGVGANNFLVQLPEYQKNSGVFWLQPVHNIIFLVVTEYGFIGLFLIFIISKKQIYNFQTNFKSQITKNKLILLGIILVTGMVDHYWLTLPQNWWLLCLVFSLI